MDLLGVRVDQIKKIKVLEKVRDFLHSNTSNIVFTPNPEMLVAAYRYPGFKQILNKSDVNICDGFGIQLLTRGKVKRIPGVDLVLNICQIAQEENKSVFLLGSESDVVLEKTKTELLRQFPHLKIVGMGKGFSIGINKKTSVHNTQHSITNYKLPITSPLINYSKDENDQLIDEIISVAPDIIFVAFGHIKQESWIVENLPQLPSVKIAMGVGGSFDYISGTVLRAPRLFRFVGLEWLWRLFRQPRRFWRIIDAVVVFPFLCLLQKLKKDC